MVLEEMNSNISHYRLTRDDKELIDRLRSRVKNELTIRYDTDFNLFRWIKHVERFSKEKSNLDLIEKNLRNHLKYRKTLNLDSDSIPDWDTNPLNMNRILSRGYLYYMPSNNRYLWWVDYTDFHVETTLSTNKSTDLLVWQFWLYEHMLRVINEKERTTGALSGVVSIIDMKNVTITPGMMVSANDGHMSYAAQLFYYDHYPELAYPVNIVNLTKILMLPYRIVRLFMPHDFTDKFRIYDSNYRIELLSQMREEELPKQLGGTNPESDRLAPVLVKKIDAKDYYRNDDHPPSDQLYPIQVSPRKRKLISIFCFENSKLDWWFQSEGQIYFGVYFSKTEIDIDEKSDILEKMEMMYPKFLVVTKHVPEKGSLQCKRGGYYYFLFCNKGSWFYRRRIQAKFAIDGRVKKELKEISIL